MLEPGSMMSVAARLRYMADVAWARSLGLKVGWLTMARISPVVRRAPPLNLNARDCRGWPPGSRYAVLDTHHRAQRYVATRARGADVLDVLDLAALAILDHALATILTSQRVIEREFCPFLPSSSMLAKPARGPPLPLPGSSDGIRAPCSRRAGPSVACASSGCMPASQMKSRSWLLDAGG
jgi:hypothetical protein